MATNHAIADLMMKGANIGHRALITLSGGRLGTTAASMPVFKVTTIGRSRANLEP